MSDSSSISDREFWTEILAWEKTPEGQQAYASLFAYMTGRAPELVLNGIKSMQLPFPAAVVKRLEEKVEAAQS